jgi:hypothetical protein
MQHFFAHSLHITFLIDQVLSDYPDLGPMIESMTPASVSSKWTNKALDFRVGPDITSLAESMEYCIFLVVLCLLSVNFMEISPLVIAQQLTLFEQSLYSCIRPWELIKTVSSFYCLCCFIIVILFHNLCRRGKRIHSKMLQMCTV